MLKMKIGILGNQGFCGGHLTDYYLAHGHSVVGIDNQSTGNYTNHLAINYVNDLCTMDSSEIKEILWDCDVVIHLASTARVQPSYQDPYKYIKNNVGNLVNVLNALQNWKGRFVYVSSSSVYGRISKHDVMREHHILRPTSPYALSKKMAEELVTYYADNYLMNTFIVRPFNVYGDRMTSLSGYSTVLQIFLENYRNKIPLDVFGDGKNTRDFTHINDFIQALNLVLDSKMYSNIFNISTGRSYDINTIVSVFPHYTNVNYLEPKQEPPHTKGSILNLKKLGYSPKYDVLEWLKTQI
jgi:UDP-glucose 4-epimerase